MQFLNKEWVRQLLGIDHKVGNFSAMALDVNGAFWKKGDPFHQNQLYVAELLERGVKVLIYAGTYDMVCNWVGNERWTLDMQWSGQEGFRSKPLVDWTVDGLAAGKTRSYGNFTFATIYGAGHLVSCNLFVPEAVGGSDNSSNRYHMINQLNPSL